METLKSLMERTDSILLLTLALIIVGVVLLRPVIKMYLDANEKQQQAQREHERTQKERELEVQREMLRVVSSNVEVNTALKTLIEQNYKHCDGCKAEQLTILAKMQEDVGFINTQLKFVGKRFNDFKPEVHSQ